MDKEAADGRINQLHFKTISHYEITQAFRIRTTILQTTYTMRLLHHNWSKDARVA
jgi:hypothetical protein